MRGKENYQTEDQKKVLHHAHTYQEITFLEQSLCKILIECMLVLFTTEVFFTLT